MSIYDSLLAIQQQLKVSKSQYNDFGKYNYRSCEDILEAVKPLLHELKLVLTLDDSLENVGNRNYVKATATLANSEEKISVSAFAREDETRKGMDGSQITGSSSSYARKYALNGLFAIDDTKDSDHTNKGNTADKKQQSGNKQSSSKQGKVSEVVVKAKYKNVYGDTGYDEWLQQFANLDDAERHLTEKMVKK